MYLKITYSPFVADPFARRESAKGLFSFMTRKQYVVELATKITKHGYWSNEVLECNTLGQNLFGLSVWYKLHDKAKYLSHQKISNND